MGGFAREHCHTTNSRKEGLTVDGQLVGVALRNNRFIIRITAFEQAANQHIIAKHIRGIGLVELDADWFVGETSKDVLQLVDGFFRHDERGHHIRLDIHPSVTHQLVGIGGNEGQIILSHLHKHARHNRTNLIHTGSENGLLEATCQHIGRNLPHRGIRHHGQLRELIALVASQFVTAFTCNQFNGQCVVIHIDGNRHIGEVLHDFEQEARRNRHLARAFHHIRNHAHRHCHVKVGGRDFQFVFGQLKQEVVQNREGVFRTDDTAQRLEILQ